MIYFVGKLPDFQHGSHCFIFDTSVKPKIKKVALQAQTRGCRTQSRSNQVYIHSEQPVESRTKVLKIV